MKPTHLPLFILYLSTLPSISLPLSPKMPPHVFPTKFLFFMMITIFLIHIQTSVFGVDEHYTSCSTLLDCANIKDIGYPFWGSSRPENCGYPGFELNCSGQAPEITIMEETYRVLDINNVLQTLMVARTDYMDNICPASPVSTSLNLSLFEYTSDTQNITLYYDCLAITNQTLLEFFNQFSCNGVVGYYVIISPSSNPVLASAISSALVSCKNNVIVPAQQSKIQSIEGSPTQEKLAGVVNDGFTVRWFANESLCDQCKVSGGQCGYNQSSSGFACYCSDQPHELTCPSNEFSPGRGKKKSNTLIVGLSIAGAAIAGIFLVSGFLFIRQRRRKIAALAAQSKSKDLPTPPSSNDRITTTTSLSQSIPSYPSLKSDLEKGSTYFGIQIFSYTELEEATDNFDPSKELGDGGFGTVYYGVLNDGRVVAVKRLYENNLKRVEQFMNEVEILAHLRHPNLVTLFGCTSRRSRELLLVYEYIPNGTVADHLHGNRANSGLLTWPVRLKIAIETASALSYLHISDVIHRDVKTNNILLDNNFCVKVADFGLSRLFPTDVTHVSTAPQGTPGYVDPEYYQCYQLTNKSDVYSFGVVLIELISAKEAVDTNRHRHDINLANMAISRIQNRTLHELVDPTLCFENDSAARRMITLVAELAFRCLQQERDMRPSMEEVLEILQGIPNEELGVQKAEVVDIGADDVGLLKNTPPPLSPDYVVTDKWIKIRTM